MIVIPKLINLTGNDQSFQRSRARSEAFQRHPEGKGTTLDTGLRRYDVKRFFQMKSLILGYSQIVNTRCSSFFTVIPAKEGPGGFNGSLDPGNILVQKT
jgi:hypothetical protein